MKFKNDRKNVRFEKQLKDVERTEYAFKTVMDNVMKINKNIGEVSSNVANMETLVCNR